MSQISLQHVYKAFTKNLYVINDFNLEIFDHEFLVLVGPSGCGKTTTLRMIAGLEELTNGNLYIDSRLQNDEDPSTRKLSFVFQNYALLPEHSVYTNIEFGLLNKKLGKLEKRKVVEDVSKKLSLYEKLGSYPHQLSGGQRQRVALARALVDNESLILFDEPLSNLDAVLRESMRSELIKLHKTFHMTCIYVTHDQIEAMAMASRIVLMKEGRILQVGSPYQMYFDPSNIEVATFIGSPDNNVVQINVKDGCVFVKDKKINLNQTLMDSIAKNCLIEGYITIRPQALKISSKLSDDHIKASVEVVENFGVNKLLHVNALNQTFRVIVDKDFVEKDTMYLDFNGEAHLFDIESKRVYDDINPIIKISKEPTDKENQQVIKAIKNYGYEVVYQAEKADVIYNSKLKNYEYIKDSKTHTLNQFRDILQHLSYIKNHQD